MYQVVFPPKGVVVQLTLVLFHLATLNALVHPLMPSWCDNKKPLHDNGTQRITSFNLSISKFSLLSSHSLQYLFKTKRSPNSQILIWAGQLSSVIIGPLTPVNIWHKMPLLACNILAIPYKYYSPLPRAQIPFLFPHCRFSGILLKVLQVILLKVNFWMLHFGSSNSAVSFVSYPTFHFVAFQNPILSQIFCRKWASPMQVFKLLGAGKRIFISRLEVGWSMNHDSLL